MAKKVHPRFEQGLPECFDDESKSGVITTTWKMLVVAGKSRYILNIH